MTNLNLPPDTNFEDIKPQTVESTKEKENKNLFDSRNYLDFSIL